MTKEQEEIIAQVQLHSKAGEVFDEEKIIELVNFFRGLIKVSDKEAEEVVVALQSRLPVKMDRGAFVKELNHKSWYYSAKANIEPKYWTRYTTFLAKEGTFNQEVINTLDAQTDDMMDLLSNPKLNVSFQRRGLVIGDVQSGKTATYLALMNKAADAGYHIVILLTGTVEKLRRQTQGRTDEGFVGLDSNAFNNNNDNVFVGVGGIDKTISGWAVTSTTSDFNTSTANKLSGQLSSIKSPVVFVIKKNKSVLEKLEQWLRIYNLDKLTGTIDSPMLMIDDEADNASVSTKTGEDPTTINKCIRKILKLFSKACYVGVTATPYANIFIDPDTESEMLGDDLFPRDFIYALEPPTNYIGADNIFPEDAMYHYMLKNNDDCENYVPLKHDKTYEPGSMPLSLKKAIASFLLANTIRDLRGDNDKHRTMMVNISVYIDVQKRIANQIDGYIREIQREIHNYYLMGDVALNYSSFAFLKSVYEELYSEQEYNWSDIQTSLWPAIASIVVRSVNGGNAAQNLNYDEHENGLRLIAIGGYSLSRGLTLEGLCISYFYRNTKMYDTLMQMGRWFGYRPNYEDLCQIWINDDAVEWYAYISEAAEELKREVRRMQEAGDRTPKDFGLCVRSDNAALLVTARNKMRTATDYTMTVSLSGNIIETPYIHQNESILIKNLEITKNLFERLILDGYHEVEDDAEYAVQEKPLYKNIPKDYILDFLSSFKCHYSNSNFHTDELVKMIKDDNESMGEWDIVVATGVGNKDVTLGSHTTKCVQRSFKVRDNYSAFQISGGNSKLGTNLYAKAGLLNSEVCQIEKNEKKPMNPVDYFKLNNVGIRRNPLLMVYPVELKEPTEIKDEETMRRSLIAKNVNYPLIGISIGIPAVSGKLPKSYQYKVNLVKYRELNEINLPVEVDESIED